MLNQPRIVVATDFSECSDHAIRAGERIRALSKGTLKVIHVTSPDWEWFLNDTTSKTLSLTFRENLLQAVQKKVDHQIKKCEANASNEILLGSPSKTIINYIESEKVDLVISGHQGVGSTPEFMGGVATRLASMGKIPVLIVKRPLTVNKVAGLVEASQPLEKTFSVTEELGILFNAQVKFISVLMDIGAIGLGNLPFKSKSYTRFTSEEIFEVKNEMEKCIRLYMDPHSKAIVRTVVTPEPISSTLKRVLEEEGVDLAILSRNQRNIVQKIFLGSVTRKILETYGGNILVLPPYDTKS